MAIAKDNDRLTIIIHKDLKKRLQELAELDNRSMSNYIVSILERHVQENREK